MVQETVSLIVSRMNALTDQEREKVLCALLNRYCVGCGRSGNWTETLCDCEPGECVKQAKPEPVQLWLTYRADVSKAA